MKQVMGSYLTHDIHVQPITIRHIRGDRSFSQAGGEEAQASAAPVVAARTCAQLRISDVFGNPELHEKEEVTRPISREEIVAIMSASRAKFNGEVKVGAVPKHTCDARLGTVWGLIHNRVGKSANNARYRSRI